MLGDGHWLCGWGRPAPSARSEGSPHCTWTADSEILLNSGVIRGPGAPESLAPRALVLGAQDGVRAAMSC